MYPRNGRGVNILIYLTIVTWRVQPLYQIEIIYLYLFIFFPKGATTYPQIQLCNVLMNFELYIHTMLYIHKQFISKSIFLMHYKKGWISWSKKLMIFVGQHDFKNCQVIICNINLFTKVWRDNNRVYFLPSRPECILIIV